jgi:hypothetical protein
MPKDIKKCARSPFACYLPSPAYLDRLREGETRAKRGRGSLTRHLELQLSNTPEGRGVDGRDERTA